jgi:hypothetical protein
MRRGFRLGRSTYHHGHRPHWPREVLSVEEECCEELAVIADHFASLANLGDQGGAARTVTAPPAVAATRPGTRLRGQHGPCRWHR